jgi:hypothetical protein
MFKQYRKVSHHSSVNDSEPPERNEPKEKVAKGSSISPISQVSPLYTITMDITQFTQGHEKTLLYFYPKDNTPGCTLEAQDFTRLKKDFESLGIHII